MLSSRFGDDRNGRELHVSDVHVWVLVKELLDLTLQIFIGGESAGVLSYPDGFEIFIRPHRNFLTLKWFASRYVMKPNY